MNFFDQLTKKAKFAGLFFVLAKASSIATILSIPASLKLAVVFLASSGIFVIASIVFALLDARDAEGSEIQRLLREIDRLKTEMAECKRTT